jgi:hypothetical protein
MRRLGRVCLEGIFYAGHWSLKTDGRFLHRPWVGLHLSRRSNVARRRLERSETRGLGGDKRNVDCARKPLRQVPF